MDQDKKTSPVDKVLNDDKYGKLMRAVDAARNILDSMKEGEKTNLKDLTDRVAKELDLSVTQVGPFVSMAVQTYEGGITVSRGRYGGIFKGIREKKEDNRERCATCKQVIRKRRAKKAKTDDVASDALQASTTNALSSHEEEFEEDDEEEDDEDLDTEDNDDDEDEES